MIKINKFNKIIAANWKLNSSFGFINDYFENFHFSSSDDTNSCVIFCPPLPYLNSCYSFMPSKTSVFLGAQNCSNFDSGPYTGEISSIMLKENFCKFCIVGHSERRHIFKESSIDVKLKSENLLSSDIIPIICIGETLEEKNKGLTKDVLINQLINSLPSNTSPNNIIIAYEPVWAIGSGLIPTLSEINEIHSFIKKDILEFENYKILYGGSVKSENSRDIIDLPNVDGVLVGGASLDPIEFSKILNS